MKTRLFAAALAGLALASIGATALAQTPAKPLGKQLVGHWRLVSVSINDQAPYGAAPIGSMFLDASGHYSVIVITAGAARNIAYFGAYTADDADGSMTMHIEASSNPAADGRDQKRYVAFDADEMIVTSRKQSEPPGGLKLTWKRDD
ncbi:MAG: lipocalin-like domain-containing protein [Roseiarcus sp.]